ncbi:MAG: hypothetical protein A2044_02220 [Candidatus Firestonebacteria bacterium GWA2_43_8]|nr:MAG: hypothetical protein A2044_02220 [Candidatus Firestonebacteria bacterium GWA2_43_8]
MDEIKKESKIKRDLDKFERWVLNPIGDIINSEKTHFPAFILIAVAIDMLSNMRYSSSLTFWSLKPKLSKKYINFIKTYFPPGYYKISSNLYHDFRCEILHSFSLRKFDLGQHDKCRHLQKTKDKRKKIYLKSSEMYKDLIGAYEKYKSELIGDNRKDEVVAEYMKGAGRKEWTHTE